MTNPHKPFVYLTALIVIVLVVPDYVQHGMFLDGTQYAIVSKNLSLGIGSFWKPFLSASWSKSGNNAFLEHPPLFFFLQSLFYKLFGTSVFVEKFYCFCNVLICSYLIYKIWRFMFRQIPELVTYWWLAILLWFITPSVFWSYRNNMIENTLSIFVLASVYFGLKAIQVSKHAIIFVLISGVSVFLGTLTKGLPALFPLSLFLIYYFVFGTISLKKTLFYMALQALMPLLFYTILITLNSSASESLSFYVNQRLLSRIDSAPLVDNRFTILFWLLTDLFVNLGLSLLLMLLLKWRAFKAAFVSPVNKYLVLFALLTLAGVAPLCLTKVQRATYFVPALPFAGMAFAVLIAMVIQPKLSQMKPRFLKRFQVFLVAFYLLTFAFIFSLSNKISRDVSVLEDVHTIHSIVGSNKEIATPMEIYCRWDFQFYLLRYYDITLFPIDKKGCDVLLLDKKSGLNALQNFELSPIHLNWYLLFEKKKIN